MKTHFKPLVLAIAAIALFTVRSFAASDYLLEIEGIDGEAAGRKFQLTEQGDGSWLAQNVPAGNYKIIFVPKTVVAGSSNLSSGGGSFAKGNPNSPTMLTLQAIVSPRDAASGLPTGKRQHKPFSITKEVDKSSPRTTVGQILVGDLDGDGAVDKMPGDPIPGLDVKPAAKAGSTGAPGRTGYDVKVNVKV